MKKQIINEQPIGTVLTGMTKGALKGALRNAFKSVLENSDNVVTDILRKEAKIAATETLDSATDILIKQLYDVKSNFYITWDELRRSGELIPKLSNNFKLSYQKRS